MTLVFTLILVGTIFVGTTIESNATTVSGNEPDLCDETISGNELALYDGMVLSNESGTENTSPYIGVSELGWDTNEPWVMKFKINDTTPGIYSIQVYCDGKSFQSILYHDDLSYHSGNYWYGNLNTELNETGDYTYQVKISSNDNEDVWDFSKGCVSEMSEVFHYERPTSVIETVTNLRWDSEREGVAKWDAVANADAYRVYLYNENQMMIGYYVYDSDVIQCDFIDELGASGKY